MFILLILPLKDVKIKVIKQAVEVDNEDGKGKQKGLNMYRDITLIGDFTEDQNQRLIIVADRCPVNKTLHHIITVSTAQNLT